jgi:hypothetical protein
VEDLLRGATDADTSAAPADTSGMSTDTTTAPADTSGVSADSLAAAE